MAIDELSKPEPDYVASLREIASLATQFEVFRFLKRLTETFGQKGFMVLRMPSPTQLELGVSSIITNWPAEMVISYDKGNLLRKSPLLARVQASTVPFTYDVDQMYRGVEDERSVHVRSIFNRANLSRGALFPVSDALGERGVIIMSGERAVFSPDEMLVMNMIAIHVFDRLFQIRQKDTKSAEALTDREIDCLTWTAAGKTSAEISEILNLSEHTVNHYLNRAARKLDTVNRTQAVAKALRAGIIR